MPPEIFASYSREDQAQVFPIVDKLRERGLNIWIDQEGIHGAKLWSQEIVNAIEGSKVFILFASAKAFVSKNVTKELALASESDKHILPIFIEDAEIPAAMKYQLAGIQHLVHEQGQTDQTADNILRTLGNLDIQFAESQPTTATTPPTTKPASKTPLIVASFVIALAVIAFLLFRGTSTRTSTSPATAKANKSTIDLCVLTTHNLGNAEEISQETRELREGLDAKLSRFKDYKVEIGKSVSPDSTTQDLLSAGKALNTEYVLYAYVGSNKKQINAKLLNVEDGRNFWAKTLRNEDFEVEEDFIGEATGLIAAYIAGHDGVIHRDILKKALVKKEVPLTPVELLQLGKALWEDSTSDNTEKAIDYLNKCIELNPDISTAYGILSEVYLEDIRGRYNKIPDAMTKAKNMASRGVELDPSNAIALVEQIWISWYEKDFASVKVQLEAALKANPYEALVHASAGAFYASTGINFEEGKKHIDLAIKYNDTPQGWYYTGYVFYYMSKEDYEKALEYVLQSAYNPAETIPMTACLFWLNEDKETAINYYQKVIEMDPNYSVADFEYYLGVFHYEQSLRQLLINTFVEISERQ